MAHQLTALQLQAMRPSLFSVATALRVGISNHGDEIVDLTPETACRNAITAVRYASPLLEKGILIMAPFAVLGYGIYRYVWKGLDLGSVVDFIRSRLVASVTVPTKYAIYDQVMAWMAANSIGVDTRSVTVHSNLAAAAASPATMNLNYLGTQRRLGSYGSFDSGADPMDQPAKPKEPSLSYVPAIGSTAFSFNGHSLWLTRQNPTEHQVLDGSGRSIKGKTQSRESDITISCYSIFGGVKPIQDFLEHISTINDVKNESLVRIYRPSQYANEGETWDRRVITRPARKLDSVSIEEHKKQDLVEDIKTYLSHESKSWYANRGIPWRRGYLFYGPPGTGKTSFCTALAGHFEMPLYILSLSNPNINDFALEMCFDALPTRCLVLLEDVDSAGIERVKKERKSSKQGIMMGPIAQKGVTLAGLLNTIDGPVSHEGRVLVMTSNSPDNLDAALLRPGRVDKKVLFGNASYEVTAQLFLHIFAETPSGKTDQKEASQHDLPALAKQFASFIPDDKLTPAEIQNYLLEMREDPVAAVDSAAKWSASMIQTKSQGRNVEKFQGQVDADVDANPQQSQAIEAAKATFGNKRYGFQNMPGLPNGVLPDKMTDSWSDVEASSPADSLEHEDGGVEQGEGKEAGVDDEEEKEGSDEVSEAGEDDDLDEGTQHVQRTAQHRRWQAAGRLRELQRLSGDLVKSIRVTQP